MSVLAGLLNDEEGDRRGLHPDRKAVTAMQMTIKKIRTRLIITPLDIEYLAH
jgi:hypothetical protein